MSGVGQSRSRSGQAGSQDITHSKLIQTRPGKRKECGTGKSFNSLNDSNPQLQLPWKLDLNQLCLGREHVTMTNSTLPGHAHPSDHDRAKAADEIIILILGAVVFVTFALGLVSQVCLTPLWPYTSTTPR